MNKDGKMSWQDNSLCTQMLCLGLGLNFMNLIVFASMVGKAIAG